MGFLDRFRGDTDTARRHCAVAELLGAPRRVLDVGGVPGRLTPWLPGVEVVAVNVEPPADILFDGGVLPFGDGAFEAVVSIDVLEHLGREDRPPHLAEVLRVAAASVVLCCPLGTPEHVDAERELANLHLRLAGEPDRFLAEHLECGLPTEAELRALGAAAAGGWRFDLLFEGDFRRESALYRARLQADARHRARDRAAYAWQRLRAGSTALAPAAGPFTNRAYIVARRVCP